MLTDNPSSPLILVVDDDINHAELIRRSFEDDPGAFQLEICWSVADARVIIERRRPVFVLTDFRLPDGDGNEVVLAARGACPVIIMTSHGNERIAVEAMKIGALDYIVKSPESIINLPRTVLLGLQSWSLVLSRRHVDEAVLRAKRDWERTFDAVPDLISIVDTGHTITRVNKAMAERCGLTTSEIIGRKCHDVVHGQGVMPVCCPVGCVIVDGEIHSVDIVEKRMNGHFNVTVSPLTNDEGEITSFVHVMRDITNQKKTEELVRQRMNLREIALTSSVDELMQVTLDACELLTDSSIGFFHLVDEDQKNLTLQAWSSNTLTSMCTAEGHGQHYPISQAGVWVECFHTREPVIHNDYASLPNRRGMPDGHAPVIRELTVPVVINDKVVSIIGVGNKPAPYTDHDVYVVKQFVVFASEVIGRKKAVIALRESEEKHRKLANEQRIILNTTSVGICFLKNRTVQWANPAFDSIFGYEVGTTIGMDTAAFYPDRESYEIIGVEAYAALDAGEVHSRDASMLCRDGTVIWCNLVGQAVNPGQSADGSIWVMMDITDRKRAEEERLLLEQQFQQTQKLESLGVLAGGIAHDFNNILTVILGHCHMVSDDFDTGMTDKTHVQHIQAAGNRAADLCRQMLAYAGNSPQQNRPVNMWLLVDEIVKMLQSAIKKNVVIQLDLKRDVPDILADSAQIQQVVMNLIINAAEAIGGNNGVITVSLRKTEITECQDVVDVLGNPVVSGWYACLEVADNGCGMDEEVQKRIFEPFFTTKFTGRGLGMSAVLGIIKSHEGALQLSSTPGTGTSFRIFLPAVVNPEEVTGDQTGNSTDPVTVSGKILLVDDEEALRSIGSVLLTAIGFSVVTACNGREALELYSADTSGIDLVMLDLVMPEMGGLETYHRLRALSPDLPIVICSGYGADGVMDLTENDTKICSLQKPYQPEMLKSVLRGLLS